MAVEAPAQATSEPEQRSVETRCVTSVWLSIIPSCSAELAAVESAFCRSNTETHCVPSPPVTTARPPAGTRLRDRASVCRRKHIHWVRPLGMRTHTTKKGACVTKALATGPRRRPQVHRTPRKVSLNDATATLSLLRVVPGQLRPWLAGVADVKHTHQQV